MLLLCSLSGCKNSAPDSESIRTHFRELTGCETHVKILSDLDETVLEYEMDYTYQKDQNDSFTITAPASLKGIGGTIAGQGDDGFSLQYDGMELDDAMPLRTGFTPADCLFWLLADLRENEPVQQWSETVSGQPLLVLRYESEDKAGPTAKQIWLTADLQPVCAELYTDGKRLLAVQIMSYRPV